METTVKTSATVSAAAVTGLSAQGTNQMPACTQTRASTRTRSSTAGRTGDRTAGQREVRTADLTEATTMMTRRGTGLMAAVLRGVQGRVRPAAWAPEGHEDPETPEDPEGPGGLGAPGGVHDQTEAVHDQTEVPTAIRELLSLVPGRLLTPRGRDQAARTNQTMRNGGAP